MRVVYVGEAWEGSCARSMKEALSRQHGVAIYNVVESVVPGPQALVSRVASRFLAPLRRREQRTELRAALTTYAPDVLLAYKGWTLDAIDVAYARARGILTVNVYPDCSPHAHGARHRRAVGAYDLVVSTKPFHPALWHSVYGYVNECAFVPQGYDSVLHLDTTEPQAHDRDVGLIATWRPAYGALMRDLALRIAGRGLQMGIGGHGWRENEPGLPANLALAGPIHGRDYVEWLRRTRICIAPVTREIIVQGVRQPGDQDTTRTYELAAARCFFVHQDTAYARTLYDAATEVPMFRDASELAKLVEWYLPREVLRRDMAAAAQRRAVPAYSLDRRAETIVALLRDRLRVGRGVR